MITNKLTQRYFEAATSVTPNSTQLPSQGSYNYLAQSSYALLGAAESPKFQILTRKAG